MAYCKECGAYIPDGESTCLACGYNEERSYAKNTEYAYSYKKERQPERDFDAEQLRRQLDEQRERQRENSRRWAEAERARREQQERQRVNSHSSTGNTTCSSGGARSKEMDGSQGYSRGMGIISYLNLWIFPMIFRRDDSFAMFHAKQGLLLSIVGALASFIGAIFDVGWLVSLARIYLIFKGISNANSGKMEPLPYIGDIVSKL